MNEAINTTKGKLLMIAMVLATMLVALAATSKPADAYTQQNFGSSGGVYPYQIQGSHHNPCAGTVYHECFNPWVVGTGPYVYRSPASTGTQLIGATYYLQKWNGSSWVNVANKTHQRYLQAGYSRIQMPRIDFLPNSGAGYYRVITVIAWTNANTNAYLGGKNLFFDQSGDYVCTTQFTSSCNANGGWVYLKSPAL